MNETVIEAIKALGIGGGPVFAFLWWLERKERIEGQKAVKEMLVQQLISTQQAVNSAETASEAINELKNVVVRLSAAFASVVRENKRSSS